MGFTYDPLWKLLIDRKMTKEQMRTELKISPATIAKMGKGGNVSMDVLERICSRFNCKIEDVVQYIPTKE
ncbi:MULTISPECIES: helix-turn-helix domain-containing protein [Bacillaceae]|uniref:helix-turn-helix domain-containing protein n=1 Tax=Bacillaceae TaxID=186817 RepID=UPI000E2E9BBB|nr:helix-turn-helix transcriptional regulator [Bacillus sp. HNG]RFB09324.1 XRE family transcriptional regulator [Bacillus sp. HNG]